jgi:hypothetical protein
MLLLEVVLAALVDGIHLHMEFQVVVEQVYLVVVLMDLLLELVVDIQMEVMEDLEELVESLEKILEHLKVDKLKIPSSEEDGVVEEEDLAPLGVVDLELLELSGSCGARQDLSQPMLLMSHQRRL